MLATGKLPPVSAPVAQGIEHGSPKAGVAGSNPAGGTLTSTFVAAQTPTTALLGAYSPFSPAAYQRHLAARRGWFEQHELPPIEEAFDPDEPFDAVGDVPAASTAGGMR